MTSTEQRVLCLLWRNPPGWLYTREANQTVHNKSSVSIPLSVSNILSLGPNFIISTIPPDMRHLFETSFLSGFNVRSKFESGIDDVERGISLHARFANVPSVPQSFHYVRKPNPNFNPPPDKVVKAFSTDVTTALRSALSRNSSSFVRVRSNVSRSEFRDLCSFLDRPDIRVVLADKNMGFAVVNTADLTSAVDAKLLSSAFERLSASEGKDLLYKSIVQFSNLLRSDGIMSTGRVPPEFFDIYNAVCPSVEVTHRPNTINPLAKVHKPYFNHKTWRLIVQAHRSPFQSFDAWFAKFLDPMLLTVDTYLRDSPSAIRLIESLRFSPSEPIEFGKVDVTDLYNNLDLGLVTKALEYFLTRHFQSLINLRVSTGPWKIETILKLLDIANRSNFVYYNGSWFRQLTGIAMGRAAGVTIAVFTLAFIEINLRETFFNDGSWLLHRRYIDDIIFIRRGNSLRTGVDVARAYKNALSIDTTVEAFVVSTDENDSKSIDILDFTITRIGDRFVISPYDKPTNLHLFIPPRSNHAAHVGIGWIRAYLQRLARNSSTRDIFEQAASDFFDHLRARGFRSETLFSFFGSFSYSRVRADIWTKFDASQRSYEERVKDKKRGNTSYFFFAVPFNKGTGSFKWTQLLNGIRDRHMEALSLIKSDYPRFRTAWSTLPSMATLVVRTLQSHIQGIPNPNPSD